MQSISISELAQRLQQQQDFLLLDTRKQQAVVASGVKIEGGEWKNPALWLEWKDEISNKRPVVVYCAYGHEISQGLTATLVAMGVDAVYLEGGIAAWQEKGQPVVAAL